MTLGRVLVVDDDRDMCGLLAAVLTRRGFEVTWRLSASEALDVVQQTDVDAVVADVDMPDMNGFELCEQVRAYRPDVPVTMLTGYANVETAVAAMRVGAFDFIAKSPEMSALTIAVERAVRQHALRADVRRLSEAMVEARGFDVVLTQSPSMQRVLDLLERLAVTDTTVLITGESGTGKELIARALHGRGRRCRGPFVAVNCAAIPATLLESELFGHVRGAFTGAHATRPGLFSQANGGTLFLDEVSELPLPLQPKLLRALQERTVRPIGGETEVPCDVRVVTATNVDIEAAVTARRFREDLFFRLNVIQVSLPPLRVRGNDILLLAQHFIERHAASVGKPVLGLSAPAAERLLAYAWPGNVRELENCIERAVVLARYDRVAVGDLADRVRGDRRSQVASSPDGAPDALSLEEIERRHIARVLEAVDGNRRLAAQRLGIDRKTLYRKLLRYRTGV